MSIEAVESVKAAFHRLLPEERQAVLRELRTDYPIHTIESEWGITAEEVLQGLARAGDMTRRMFKGVLAEGACKIRVIDKLEGWQDQPAPGDPPYDFLIQRGTETIKIQTKLQRSNSGKPLAASKAAGLNDPDQWVVEVQRSRAGVDAEGNSTRPVRFGEFDILAVSMWPSTGDWNSFMFTVSRWLVPRADNPSQIAIFQPVAKQANEFWTDKIEVAIGWHQQGDAKTIPGSGAKIRQPRKRKGDSESDLF